MIDAFLIRQTGVGNTGDPGASQLGECPQGYAHQLRTCRAVEAQVQQIGVQQGDSESLGILPRQHGSGRLDGHRDGHRHSPTRLSERPFDRQKTGLDIASVLAGLEQQIVGPAGHQTQSLDAIVLLKLFEGHSARHRDGLGGRSHGATHKARPGGYRERPGSFAGQFRRQPVEIVGLCLQVVLSQYQRCATEAVGLHDVGAGFEIALVQPQHHVGPRQAQVLVAAFEVGSTEILGCQVLGLRSRSR